MPGESFAALNPGELVFSNSFGRTGPFSIMTRDHAARRVTVSQILPVERTTDSAADLLIPAGLLPYAFRLKCIRGEWRDLIVYLVSRHRARMLFLAGHANNLRFRYQEPGLDLHRISYIPYSDMIAELRMLSFACRMSMCAIVVLMLLWEQQRENTSNPGSFIGTPLSLESAWNKTGALLIITATIIPIQTHDPPSRS